MPAGIASFATSLVIAATSLASFATSLVIATYILVISAF